MKNYLIISEYYNIIDEELKKILTDNSEIINYDAEVDDIDQLSEDIYSVSLFNNSKTIIYKNFDGKVEENIKEKFEKFITDFITQNNPNITFIMTSNKKLDERKKLTKIFKEHFKIINLLDEKDYFYLNRIKELLVNENVNMNENSIRLLWSKTVSNYDIAINELKKIFICLDNERVVSKELVEKYTPQYVDDEIFEIKDLIIKNKPDQYKTLLNDYRLAKKSIVPLIGLLANDYRLMYIVKNNDSSDNDLAKEMRMNSAYPIVLARKNSYNYQSSKLLDYILALANLDIDIKSGEIDEYIGFELFLLETQVI